MMWRAVSEWGFSYWRSRRSRCGCDVKIEWYWHVEMGRRLPAAVWRPGPGWRMISSAMLGGGIGPATWVINAQVPGAYSRMDPTGHLRELATAFGLDGTGVGLLTAADVGKLEHHCVEDVHAAATVGLRVPTWAAVPPGTIDPDLTAPDAARPLDADSLRRTQAVVRSGSEALRPAPAAGRSGPGLTGNDGTSPSGAWRPGTVNIVVAVPVALTDAGLVNAVITATEAKTQALLEAGYPCTGTASDAICIAAPSPAGGDDEGELFAGPRSEWGARIARAVHAAVHAGALGYRPAD